jgi:hypothetical protein
MGRKQKRIYSDDELIGLPPAHISGADHRLLVETLKTVTDSETGKPVKLGKFLDRLVTKQVQEIRKGKRIKI